MIFTVFNGEHLKTMLIGAANNLAACRAEIDALNVFPVPDGDTGTNMHLTLLSGVREAERAESAAVDAVAAAAARGCLFGARGNSGVILSQIIQGFADGLAGRETAGVNELATALAGGTEYAYRAVTNPVEGTILTVCRALSEALAEAAGTRNDLLRVLLHAYRQSQQALERTPAMLPQLKQAGVVDAGGKGLVVIIEGILQALRDVAARKDIELFDLAKTQQRQFASARGPEVPLSLSYTYCTEFLLRGEAIPLETLKAELAPYGDCLLVVGDGTMARVHLHANHPGLVLECGLKYGALQSVSVNNMEEQSLPAAGPAASPERLPVAVVAVGLGEGISAILQSMGASKVVSGGQTMNPSTADLQAAITATAAEAVIVLPNNKNVMLAAEQAARLVDRPVKVLPARAIPQGIAALLAFNPYDSLAANCDRMSAALAQVKSGEVTRAVRASCLDGQAVRAGDYLGLAEDSLCCSGPDLEGVLDRLVAAMLADGASLVTLYYGGGLATQAAEALRQGLAERHAGAEFELHYGGQPHYHFIVSAE